MSTERRNAGYRLPVELIEAVRDYAEQTRRSANAAAEVLIERGLRAAAESGEYSPGAGPR